MEKEKLNLLKQQWQLISQRWQEFQSQCKELSEEELKEVTGGFFTETGMALPGPEWFFP